MRRLFAFTLLLSFLVGCQTKETPSTGKTSNQSPAEKQLSYPIPVAATVGMVADLVTNVGGEYVTVTQIMGSGVDPHMHKASRDDVQMIMNADIVFYSGLMLEGKMADTLIKVSRNKPVFAVTELIDQKSLLEPEDFNGHYDPHLWMDVAAWSLCVDAVKDALTEVDPTHAQAYQKNATEYKKQLEILHEYGLKSTKSIPKDSRILITSHDAFNYFGRAYGLNVQGIQGISTESEAGLKRINDLVDMLVKKNVKAVFVESSVSKKNITALIDGAKAQGHEIKIGGELFSDAMGQAGTYEGTYVGMLDHNFTIVTRALGGNAPEKGMQGKLSH
ncbi:MAG: zinc ABC transporter substrate-binding protein [Planctomycetes bacterium]|nr:zinc ABC transporter substrate-binding protein [Planctomycetota bacterium]MCH9725914.1 zinc ABC transporter substrate-binding protein [Planctomycetota bacterium]MCH9777067.1 zinc ABC transporter substrate-binding protein [Planctomycetota bacterium]MCH9789971.1 zinc ABC transporter substrate-binding protein [Planctomycetota bacterium]